VTFCFAGWFDFTPSLLFASPFAYVSGYVPSVELLPAEISVELFPGESPESVLPYDPPSSP
jgi:hypothetical protein